MQDGKNISVAIKEKARQLGFLECAILKAESLDHSEKPLKNWLEKGYHGEMGYMTRNLEKRLDPRLLVENARSVIIVLQNYYTQLGQHDANAPVLSKYAFGKDYHVVMKDKLFQLFEYIKHGSGKECDGRVFVDSAPVLERAWAHKAGLGWIGRNSNLISPTHGSFFFIGELIIDLELPYDQPVEIRDHCGKCTRCIDACPTKAIVADRTVDARKCISYQTIELKGELDKNLSGKFENRVFGCDICQDVCPWNLKCTSHDEPGLMPVESLLKLTSDDWYKMEKPLFETLFRNSAVKRTGFEGLKRNLAFLNKDGENLSV